MPKHWTSGDIGPHLPNCGVFAAATVARLPTHAVMNWFQRRYNSNWRGRMRFHVLTDFLDQHGIRYDVLDLRDAKPRWRLDRCNRDVFRTAEKIVGYTETRIIEVTNHFVTLEQGVAIDRYECADLGQHWSRTKLVKRVVTIISDQE